MNFRNHFSYSKRELSDAGVLIATSNGEISNKYLQILNEYRYSHDFITKNFLKQISKHELVKIASRRLKRTQSIIHKINRSIEAGNRTQLHRMYDIGGCRCVFDNISEIMIFIDWLKKENHGLIEKKYIDYIIQPKSDGYRGIHLIFEYNNLDKYRGLQLELQLRTKLQHSWATAVEMIDLANESKLKFGEGNKDFKDFFMRVSILFQNKEGIKNSKRNKAKRKVKQIDKKVNVINELENRKISYEFLSWFSSNKKNITGDVILQITRDQHNISIKPVFSKDNPNTNLKDLYFQLEKETLNKANIDIVFISGNELEKAYPNYIGDASYFITQYKKLI